MQERIFLFIPLLLLGLRLGLCPTAIIERYQPPGDWDMYGKGYRALGSGAPHLRFIPHQISVFGDIKLIQ